MSPHRVGNNYANHHHANIKNLKYRFLWSSTITISNMQCIYICMYTVTEEDGKTSRPCGATIEAILYKMPYQPGLELWNSTIISATYSAQFYCSCLPVVIPPYPLCNTCDIPQQQSLKASTSSKQQISCTKH